MAVVSFWGNNAKETGQTLAVVAIGTEMAIDHNNKILIVSTGFKETTMEDCFWERKKNNGIVPENGAKTGGIANGFEGLIKVIQSNRTSSNIIRDYAKVVFKSRLDVLPAPTTRNPKMYNTITSYYKDVLKFANKEYDLVLVDVDKRISVEDKSAILQVSDAVVITFKQGLEEIEEIKQLREQYPDKKKTNIMFMMGKYDFDSKYNTKNITRMLKETKEISAVPYNIGFYEASMEGKVADFFLNNRTLNDSSSANAKFLQECKRGCDNILAKLEDLKMRM